MARNFPDSLRYQSQAKWAQQELWDKPQQISEINGSVLLIVGYGSIGRELARRARAFAVRVWGVTRSGNGYTLKGAKTFVLDGHVADLIIVAARTSGAPGETKGITLEQLQHKLGVN